MLNSSQSDSAAFPLFLDTYATRLLAEPLSPGIVPNPKPYMFWCRIKVAEGRTKRAGGEIRRVATRRLEARNNPSRGPVPRADYL